MLKQYIDQVTDWLKCDKTEKEWQKLLLKIFPIIFPQYIAFLREQRIPITQNSHKMHDIPDYLALKDTFSLDIIEIKKPLYQVLRNSLYRGNYVLGQELQGQITQTQKYLYSLTRWGRKGEENLTKKFKSSTNEPTLKSYIRNPKAILIIGRSNCLNDEQIRDFEILRQKHEDIIDIITYDDLLKRMQRVQKMRTNPHSIWNKN